MALADTLRLSVFILVLGAMLLWEGVAARRPLALPRHARWPANFAMVVTGTIGVRLLIPLTLIEAATWTAGRGLGLFWQAGLSLRYAIPLTLVALDLAVYAQHVALHKVGVLWRVHSAHHADLGFDATTGVRFHPIELVLSTLFKSAVVVGLGAPAGGVLLFEIWLNTTSLFTHGNVSLGRLDGLVRRLVVTPDMHRVHHSVHRDEHGTNFGFGLSVWDRLFGTYRAEPREGHERMTLGLGLRPEEAAPIGAVLRLPFRRG